MRLMQSQSSFRKKTAYMGLFLALSLICSYVEVLIPINFGIPGVKLGLTNIVIVLTMYCIGEKEALGISVLRILLSGLLFGNLFSVLFSLAGGILSFFVMVVGKRFLKLKCIAVSTSGGIAHNVGQLLVAAFVVDNFSIFYYIPVLIVSGVLTGLLIGVIAQELVLRIGKLIRF